MTSRRLSGWGYALALLGGLLVVIAAGRHWAVASYRTTAAFPATRLPLTGTQLDPLPEAFGFVVLAGAGARLAVRGRLRPVVGVIVAACAAVALVAGLSTALHLGPSARSAAAAQPGALGGRPAVTGSAWPWLAVVGAAAALAGGAILVPAGGSGLSGRYAAAGARAPEPAGGDEDVATWDALDRGEDPTESSAAAPRQAPPEARA